MKNKVLTIGPDYKTLKGGIASVLSVYAKYDNTFCFLPTYSSENNFINLLSFPFKYFNILLFIIMNPNYKIIHIHGASRISFYRKYILFLSLKYLLKRRIIYHIHGGEFHLFEKESNVITKKLIHHMINKSNLIICLSEEWKNFFLKTFNPKKVLILNNIISMPLLVNVLKKKNLLQFIFLGKIVEGKGIFDLLNTIHKNKEYLNNKIKLVIGGDGETKRLKEEIHKLNITNIVEYIGWISGEDKDKLLSESDINILPSYNEGLPISILEAMSYKMPIIATNVGGIPRVVKNEKNGILIEAGNYDMIFKSMKYFIENINKIEEYGNNSFDIVQDFLPKKVIKDLINIYNDVLKDENGN